MESDRSSGSFEKIDDAIGSLGVGVDSPARLAGYLAEVDFSASLGVDVEVEYAVAPTSEVKLVRSSTLPAPLAWIVAPLGCEN